MSNQEQITSEKANIVSSINELTDQDFKTIVDASIVFLNDRNRLERLNKLNESILQTEKDNCKEIVLWTIKQLTLVFKQNIELAKVGKHFHSNLGLDEAKSAIVKKLVEKHSASIKETMENQSIMISKLIDMEWKFGVTASSNHIDKIGNAFLQLKLVYDKGGQLETKFMELTLPQFYSLLLELNKAKSQMDYLS